MRNKKRLLAVLATAAMACSLTITGGVLTASAGTVENKPAGDGMIAASGALNLTNFKTIGEASAYKPATGNHALHLKGLASSEGDQFLPWQGVSKTIMAKEGVKVRYQMDLYKFAGDWSGHANQWVFNPLGSGPDAIAGSALLLSAYQNDIYNMYNTSVRDDDHKLLVTPNGATDPIDISAANAHTGVCAMIWRGPEIQPVINANGKATFYADVTLKADKWANVELGVGVADETGAIAESTITAKATVENWAQYNPENDLYFPSMFKYGMDSIIDDLRITATYTEDGATKTDEIAHYDMEDESKIVSAWKEGMDGTYILSQASELVVTSELGISVTNPEAGSGIVTRSALATDKTLPTNLNLETKVALNSLAAGQKVGFAFGFENSRELTGAHKYLYFKAEENKVLFCGESVNAENATTELFTPVEIEGAAVGLTAAAIPVKFTGKLADLEISVGGGTPFTVENFDPNGFFAVMHKGEGNLSYAIRENLTMTGYEFRENAEEAKAISSNFTGNYINTNKFQLNSQIAPDTHIVKANATHEITGVTAEEGKVGFYGTSTGTRILTKEQYSDFVMQFDYTSIPVQQKGQLVTAGARYSAAYMVFGMKEGGLAITDPTVYTIGIEEGLQYNKTMYSDNESVISALGAANKCGAVTRALAKMKEVQTPNELSIPVYAAGGYDATKPNNNVATWYDPDPTNAANVYSFYAKTSRVKLVAIDNKIAVYAAEVDTATGAIKGDYVLLMSFTAEDSFGYLGIATDSPAWFEIDNLAITPISRTDTLAWAASDAGKAVPAASIVADVAAADMANDPAPTPLAKPVLTANAAEKKVTWAAVTGAKEYNVTVKLGSDTVLEETVTATEISLASLTAEGSYKVTVEAVPSDLEANLSSRETLTYKVETATDPGTPGEPEPGTPGETDPAPDKKGGCGGIIAGGSILGILAVGTVCVAACILVKRKKN